MVSQFDIERERYEARLKFASDYRAGLKVARMEGRMEGLIQGRNESQEVWGQIAAIRLAEQLLSRPQTPKESLILMSLEELNAMVDELVAEYRNKRIN